MELYHALCYNMSYYLLYMCNTGEDKLAYQLQQEIVNLMGGDEEA